MSACAVLAALSAYAWPMALGLATNVTHTAYHVVGALREHRSLEDGVPLGPGHESHGFVHSHGGAAHSHGAATDALLRAASQTEHEREEEHAPASELSLHLPGAAPLVRLASALLFSSDAPALGPIAHGAAAPPSPPPRG